MAAKIRGRDGTDDPLLTLSAVFDTIRESDERRYIDAVLEQTHGNRVQAARILGIDRKTLYRRQRQRADEADED